jgi:hypothetical protein
MEIEITLTATVKHVSGPEIADPNHVTAWTVADGQWYNGNRTNSLDFEVCPKCVDPDACECDDEASIYRMTFVSADYVTLAEFGS